MSADLSNTAILSGSGVFVDRIKAAMSEAAIAVYAETEQPLGEHEIRLRLARQVMRDPETAKATFVQLVCDDTAISAEADPAKISDAGVRAVIAASWTRVALELGF